VEAFWNNRATVLPLRDAALALPALKDFEALRMRQISLGENSCIVRKSLPLKLSPPLVQLRILSRSISGSKGFRSSYP